MRFRNLEKYKTGGSGNNLTLGIPLPRRRMGACTAIRQTICPRVA
jgi:hypothetical protein